MDKTKQLITIAEFHGWTYGTGMHGLTWWTDPDGCHNEPPDYLNDLNAIHEVEKKLTATNQWSYAETLAIICGQDLQSYCRAENDFILCHATAGQRAEALIRVLGEWEDDK